MHKELLFFWRFFLPSSLSHSNRARPRAQWTLRCGPRPLKRRHQSGASPATPKVVSFPRYMLHPAGGTQTRNFLFLFCIDFRLFGVFVAFFLRSMLRPCILHSVGLGDCPAYAPGRRQWGWECARGYCAPYDRAGSPCSASVSRASS